MASPALLFLLLVSSSLLRPVDSSVKASRARPKREAVTTALGVVSLLTPFVNVLFQPSKDKIITATLNLATGGLLKILNKDQNAKLLNEIKNDIKSLSFKMEDNHIEQKWLTEAQALQKIEENINDAWDKYQNVLKKHDTENNKAERKKLKDEFIKFYKGKRESTKKLHRRLTVTGTSSITNIATPLQEYTRCHEQDIKAYTDLFNLLMYRGNVMNLFYDYYKNVTEKEETLEQASQMCYDVAKALFDLHHSCLIKSEDYIQKDVVRLIKNDKSKDDLAHTVQFFLAENYPRYDWIVVAYKTKSSNYKKWFTKWLNNHILEGFMKVEQGEITVAVARQVKGTHKNAAEVQKDIKECIGRAVKCHKISEKLSQCEKIKSKPYTAVHAFLMNAHQSTHELEVTASPETGSFFYKGECSRVKDILTKILPKSLQSVFNAKTNGNFVVMIKRDQEWSSKPGGKIEKVDPCSVKDCGSEQHGHCVPVKGLFIGLCKCHSNRYGEKCEGSVEDDKKKILEELEKVQ